MLDVVARAACATAPDQSAEPRGDKVYRTGSNLPVRDKAGASEVKVIDPSTLYDRNPARNPRPQ